MNHRHQLSTTAAAGGSQQGSGLRRIACLAALLVISIVGARAYDMIVNINEQNFPDQNFRNWVYINCDKNLNYILEKTEIADVTSINVNGKNISNLKGIEYFTALTQLVCYDNQLTALDLSKNSALTELSCYKNQLTSLNVSGCTALKTLYCQRNQIKGEGMSALVKNLPDVTSATLYVYTNSSPDGNEMTTAQVAAAVAKGWSVKQYNAGWVDYAGVDPGIAIDATNFPDEKFREYVSSNCDTDKDTYLSDEEIAAVTEISVWGEGISDLKGIEYFTALTALYCNYNNLTSLDVSKNTALTDLFCEKNQLTSLDVSKNTALKLLECCSNQLTSLDVSKNTALTELWCYDNQLTSLDVTKNTALKELGCYSNKLTSLDVSKNTALTHLYCNNNKLTSLDVSKNTALTHLYCNSNQLTTLDVSKNTALIQLYCISNQLTSLDVSKNTALTYLFCEKNQLTSLDVSKNTALTILSCYNNQIQGAGMATLIENLPTVTYGEFHVYNTDGTDGNRITSVQVAAAKANGWNVQTSSGSDYAGVDPGIAIDATNFPDEKFREYVSTYCDKDKDTYLSDEEIAAVKGIYVPEMSITNLKGIEYFTALTYLDCGYNELTSLDVSKNTALTGLECNYNQLTTLDVSKNTALTYLICDYNQLTTLDVSKNTALTVMGCNGNKLTSLDVSKNTALIHLQCYDTQLTSLDVSKNTALTELRCGRNQLTSLDVSKNTALTYLRCYNNQIRGAGMATLINGLPTVTSGKFYVYNIKGTEGNQITTVQVAAAKAKGWSVETADGDDYPGINVPGDANGDGEVNATDITTVRDYILGLDPKPFSLESANLNGDSTVDIQDLAKLIQLLTE